MRMHFWLSVSFGALTLAAACSGSPGARESTVRGTAALQTFAVGPTAIVARDEIGSIVRGAVDGQGRFTLPLSKGHTYRLALEGSGAGVPIVFPRASGLLDASFVLKTNGASLGLGQVRYYPSAPASGFHVLSAKVPAAAPAGDCVDCVNDDSQVTCESSDSTEGASEAAGADTAEQADANAELAVGDQNVPEQVAGCDSQEGDNVDRQQEGER
jgi:hypothetical protein